MQTKLENGIIAHSIIARGQCICHVCQLYNVVKGNFIVQFPYLPALRMLPSDKQYLAPIDACSNVKSIYGKYTSKKK